MPGAITLGRVNPPDRPFAADRVLGWMARHGDRLQALLAEQEAFGNPVRRSADDGALRAHLQFLAEALHATADPRLESRLAMYRDELQGWFDAQQGELDAHLDRAEGAMALQEHLQFGTRPGHDPSLDASPERRHRILAWVRLAIIGLESALGPEFDGLADDVLAWMGDRQRDLSQHVLTLLAHVKTAYEQRSPGEPMTAETTDEIGQTAAVRGTVRHLVTALQEAVTIG